MSCRAGGGRSDGRARAMKVMHVHWRDDSYGGGERYLHGIRGSQERMGLTVVTVSDRRYGSDPAAAPGSGRRHLIDASMGVRTGMREMRRVLGIVDAESPDLVHLHHTTPLISPMILRGIVARFPTVKTVHDVSLLCPHAGDAVLKVRDGRICERPCGIGCLARGCEPLRPGGVARLIRNSWERRVSRKIGRIIVSSRFMKRECVRNGLPEGTTEILPMYVEIPEEGPAAAGGDAPAERIPLFVGRLDAAKGVRDFVEALHRIRGETWTAWIVGDGPAREEVEAKIRALGLAGRIALHGKVASARLGDMYRRARLLAMPSLIPESFGLAGVEAMSFGKAVVAYDSGGISDWLVDGETGFLVERGDIRALAARMSALLADDSAAAGMGKRGMERATALYGKERHLKRLHDIYREVVDRWR